MDTIDRGVFRELQDSAGPEFVTELAGTFLEDAPALLAELQRALASGDAAAFKRAAHTLKSNSNTFGAAPLSVLARELELADLAALGPQAAPKLQALAAQYEATATALRELCRG